MTALISSHINEPENLTFPSVILTRTVVHLCAQKLLTIFLLNGRQLFIFMVLCFGLVTPDLGCKARLDVVCMCSHMLFPVLYLLYYITTQTRWFAEFILFSWSSRKEEVQVGFVQPTSCVRCNILIRTHFPVQIRGVHRWNTHWSMPSGLCSTSFSM